MATVYIRYVYGHLKGYIWLQKDTFLAIPHIFLLFKLSVCICVCVCLIWSYKYNYNNDHHISCLGVQTEVASFHLLFHPLLSSCSSVPYPMLLSRWFFQHYTQNFSLLSLRSEKSYYSVKLVQRMWLLRDIIPKRKHSYALTSFWFSSSVYFSKLILLFWQAIHKWYLIVW